MTYQVQSLGSFAEPREVNRTSQWYKEQPSSGRNIKRLQHKLFEKRFNQYLRGRNW